MSRRYRLTGCATALALAPVAAACSGAGGGHAVDGSPRAAGHAVRWWSAGDYCGMLRETVAAGRNILPGVSASDPSLLTSTREFVTSVERLAPSPVAASWKVVGGAVLRLVGSGGRLPRVTGAERSAVERAATAIADHARTSCHLDLAGRR